MLTSRQMAMFGQLFLNQGRWADKQVISADWITKSTSAIYPLSKGWGGVAHSYGYLWWIATFKSANSDLVVDGYYAGGNGGQYIVVLPALDMVVVFTGSNFGDHKTSKQTIGIVEKFVLPSVIK